MSKERINNLFQNSLEHYASDIDSDQLWSAIEGRVPRKKRKRRSILWLFLGIPLLGILLWGNATNSSPTETSIAPNQAVNSSVLQNEIRTKQNGQLTESPINSALQEEDIQVVRSEVEHKALKKGRLENRTPNFQSSPTDANEPIEEFIKPSSIQNSEKGPLPIINRIHSPLDLLPLNSLQIQSQIIIAQKIEIPRIKRKNRKRIKPKQKKKSLISINYLIGRPYFKEELSPSDDQYVNYGEGNMSQGISFSYSRYLTGRMYGRVIIALDRTYKKYMDKISRDTIVPTSSGEQIINYNEYSNGVIDTELGIPMVNGVLNREVTKLNSFSSFSIGLGLGYTQPLGKLNVNAEIDFQRSFFMDLKGLGREVGSDRILSLDRFENYFNSGSQIGLNTNLTVDYFIASGILVNGGVQYQWGRKSLLNVQTGHSEYLNLLRMRIGIKKIL